MEDGPANRHARVRAFLGFLFLAFEVMGVEDTRLCRAGKGIGYSLLASQMACSTEETMGMMKEKDEGHGSQSSICLEYSSLE